jgi:MFS family permease
MPAYLPIVVEDLSGPDDIPQISATINALYIAGWTIGGFTWGFVSDRIGRSQALALSVGSFGALTLVISFAVSWEWVVVARLLSGFAVGGILVITPTLLSEIWPASSRSVILGIDSIGFPVGIFSTAIVNYFVNDWREAFYIGIPPLFIGIVAMWVLMESSNWHTSKAKSGKVPIDIGVRENLVKGSIIFGAMLIGLWGMFSWIPSWVQNLFARPYGMKESGIALMLLGAGGLTGGFISGWISNILGVRRAMLLCFSGCIGVSFLLFATNALFSPVIYVELALLSMFFGISQGLLSIYIPQLFPFHIRGTYTGICFNIGRILTSLAVFFVGVLVSQLGGYANALLTFAGIFIVGFIAVFFTKDQIRKPEQAWHT